MKKSRHAEKRIRERVGVGKKGSDRLVEDLQRDGIPLHRLKGNLHRWVISVIRGGGRGFDGRIKPFIFRNYLYVTGNSGDVIITVIPIPQNLVKNLKGYIKEETNEEN